MTEGMENHMVVQSENIDKDNSSTNNNNFEQTMNNPLNNLLKCSGCKKDLPLSDFYITTNFWHEKRGRTYKCKECSRKSARDSVAKKRQKVKDETVLSG